jgi:hypothetical protein
MHVPPLPFLLFTPWVAPMSIPLGANLLAAGYLALSSSVESRERLYMDQERTRRERNRLGRRCGLLWIPFTVAEAIPISRAAS